MPGYVTFTDLERVKTETRKAENLLKEASKRVYKTVFLSHSSKDHSILPTVIEILENHGGKVYIDDTDPRLSGNVSTENAQTLKRALDDCRKLILLISSNTKDSNWIPWELGLADGKKSSSSVALFPIAKSKLDNWPEQEYLGLYHRIIWSKFTGKQESVWMVWDHHLNSAVPLRDWLTR